MLYQQLSIYSLLYVVGYAVQNMVKTAMVSGLAYSSLYSTVGDRAFQVAAVRIWNGLSSLGNRFRSSETPVDESIHSVVQSVLSPDSHILWLNIASLFVGISDCLITECTLVEKNDNIIIETTINLNTSILKVISFMHCILHSSILHNFNSSSKVRKNLLKRLE